MEQFEVQGRINRHQTGRQQPLLRNEFATEFATDFATESRCNKDKKIWFHLLVIFLYFLEGNDLLVSSTVFLAPKLNCTVMHAPSTLPRKCRCWVFLGCLHFLNVSSPIQIPIPVQNVGNLATWCWGWGWSDRYIWTIICFHSPSIYVVSSALTNKCHSLFCGCDETQLSFWHETALERIAGYISWLYWLKTDNPIFCVRQLLSFDPLILHSQMHSSAICINFRKYECPMNRERLAREFHYNWIYWAPHETSWSRFNSISALDSKCPSNIHWNSAWQKSCHLQLYHAMAWLHGKVTTWWLWHSMLWLSTLYHETAVIFGRTQWTLLTFSLNKRFQLWREQGFDNIWSMLHSLKSRTPFTRNRDAKFANIACIHLQ